MPIWDYMAFSCNNMFRGTYPAKDLAGRDLAYASVKPGDQMYGGVRVRLCELRGDWKHHAQSFKLAGHFTAKNICHACRASRSDGAVSMTDFRREPAWLGTVRTQAEFLTEQLQEPINSLVYVAGFHYSMLRFCSMHVVQLGTGLHANGGGMWELLKVGHFQGRDRHAQFRAAFRSFREFLNAHKIVCSQPQFKTWMLVNTGEEYCFFVAKASLQSFNSNQAKDLTTLAVETSKGLGCRV